MSFFSALLSRYTCIFFFLPSFLHKTSILCVWICTLLFHLMVRPGYHSICVYRALPHSLHSCIILHCAGSIVYSTILLGTGIWIVSKILQLKIMLLWIAWYICIFCLVGGVYNQSKSLEMGILDQKVINCVSLLGISFQECSAFAFRAAIYDNARFPIVLPREWDVILFHFHQPVETCYLNEVLIYISLIMSEDEYPYTHLRAIFIPLMRIIFCGFFSLIFNWVFGPVSLIFMSYLLRALTLYLWYILWACNI